MNSNIDTCTKEYKVLGLEVGADETKIKPAYRKLSLKHHPDKHMDSVDTATQKFLEISNAHELLIENKCWEVSYTFYNYMQNQHHYTGNDYQYKSNYDQNSYANGHSEQQEDSNTYAKGKSEQQEDSDTMSIFELAEKGKNEKLKKRLKQGESPNTDNQSQESPLSAAMFNSNKEGVKILLEHEAHFNSFDFKIPDWDREDLTYEQRIRPMKLQEKVIEDWNTENSIIVMNAFCTMLNDTSETDQFLLSMAKKSKNIALKRALEANFSQNVGYPMYSVLAAALHSDNEEGARILLTHNATFGVADFKIDQFENGEEKVNGLKNKTLEFLKQENSAMARSIASISYDELMWVQDSFLLEIGLKAGASPNTPPNTDDCCKNSFLATAIHMKRAEHVRILAEYGAHFNSFDFSQTGHDSWNGLVLKRAVLEDWGKKQHSILPPKTVFNNFSNEEFKALFSESLQKDMPAEVNESSHLSEALEMINALSGQIENTDTTVL